MKRFLSIALALCMMLCAMPTVTLAAEGSTIKAVRTAYFNSASEWKLTDDTTGSDNVLVASGGSDGWQAQSQFVDTDGTVTEQTTLDGTGFNTPRNALVAFTLPEDVDYSKAARVTLSLTIKNVKQVTSGVRLAVYGNSVDGVWSLADGKEAFGASGSNSGLSGLECVGLTSAIKTGNQTGETASGETVTLASRALTDYVVKMAAEGKSEVTFRIATPLGGIRIYDYNSAYAPTLKIEEGTLTSAAVRTVCYDENGEPVNETEETVPNLLAGESYTYDGTPTPYIVYGGYVYAYSAEKSTLSVKVGEGDVIIAYVKYDGGDSFSGYEMSAEGAWCWFADPRTISYKSDDGSIDVTIIGYIDVHGNIKATQVNNITNKVDEILIRSNIQPDDHNNPTFLVLPDERIMVFYSRHTDEPCFWYRVTEEKGDLTTLGEEKCLKTSANTTYPSPFLLSDDPENIYLCWRGIGWHPTIAKISIPDENGDAEFTYGPYQMVQSTGARPYTKYASNGKDRIYLSYTTGHPDNEDPNWLYFNQVNIENMTLENINGEQISVIADGAYNVNKSDKSQPFIVDCPESGTRDWLWQVAVAKDGYPVIAVVKINSAKTSHDYYYCKWNGSKWTMTFLTNAGGKFHSSNTEYCYSGGMGIDADNPNIIYCSKPAEGVFGSVYEIFKYTMSDDGTEILNVEQITKNSMKNNVRPFVIPNSEGDDLRLIWMNGDYQYWMVNKSYPSGYPTAAMTNVPLPSEEINLEDAVFEENYSDLGGAFASTAETKNKTAEKLDSAQFAGGFTVSADIYLDGEYEGEMLDLGGVSFRIENMPTLYSPTNTDVRPRAAVTINGADYVSPNVYGTSDDWKYYSTGTNGDYYFTQYDGYVNITLSYDGEYLTLYRDALVDLKVKAEGVNIDRLITGGFDGYITNVKVFDRALNNDEIHALAENKPVVTEIDAKGTDVITINYVTDSGKTVIPSETEVLNTGTDIFILKCDEEIFLDGILYRLNSEKSVLECEIDGAEDLSVTAVYDRFIPSGDNLVPSGSFEDENGNFDWGTWQSPRGDGYFKDICEDWFYKVNAVTNEAALYQTGNITAGDYALGTRWNDGTAGLCSMSNFIAVEAGKTYYVSYDYKHKTDGTNAGSIRTTFQKTAELGADDSKDNHTPESVTTSWQTNEFAITAPEDGYIYFHFYWLGSGGSTNTGSNSGSGPYWYFDNFKVREYIEAPDVIIDVKAAAIDEDSATLTLTNKTKNDMTEVLVFAVSVDDEATVTAADMETIDLASGETKEVSFNAGGSIRVFIWDKSMRPICEDVFESSPQN